MGKLKSGNVGELKSGKVGVAEKWKSGGGWKAVQGMSVAHRESSCEGGRVRSDFENDHYQPSWYQKISEF